MNLSRHTDSLLVDASVSARYGSFETLRNVEIAIRPGEILGLAGESGSGKSTLAMALLRLLEFRGGSASGKLNFRGVDLLALRERAMRRIRGSEIGYVPQSPASSLNPALRVRTILREAWRAHEPKTDSKFDSRVREVLCRVNLPGNGDFLARFPRQLSVGQGQRLLIALGVLHRPRLLIADEPTSALDLITQAEIMKLFSQLSAETGMAILFVSHDLTAIANLCHRVAILRRGEILETGTVDQIFYAPAHPYTAELIRSIPRLPGGAASGAVRSGLSNLSIEDRHEAIKV